MRSLYSNCWSVVFWSWLVGLWNVEYIAGLQPVLERTWFAKFRLSDAWIEWLSGLLRGSLGWLSLNNHFWMGKRLEIEGLVGRRLRISEVESLLLFSL